MDAPPPWPSRSPKKCKMERVPDQETPPGSGSAGLDLISALPDAVLCTIISLLPTKEAGRTQAVARRWRPLWRSAPINLVADFTFSCTERKRVAYISKILAEHPGPALRFELPYVRRCDYDKIDGWLRSQALTDLQELHLGYDVGDPPLSPFALRFAPTLRVALFTDCLFPDLSAQSLNFPHLKQLTMWEVIISEDALHDMLSRCLSLESLLLENNHGFARLRISSPSIRSIGFSAYPTLVAVLFQELVIEDAPCLERLLPLYPDDGPATVRIIRAPKLQVLGLLSNGISTLHVGTTVFQEMTAIRVTTTMRTVKVLAIESFGPNLDAVIGFLKCFPCLERLYVLVLRLGTEMKKVQKYDPLDPIECLESYLKRVVLQGYSGDMLDVEFAKFFILNAKVLEEMKFASINSCDCKWKSDQQMWLQVDSRASRDARFEFTGSCKGALIDKKHTHDLSMADPFERAFNFD